MCGTFPIQSSQHGTSQLVSSAQLLPVAKCQIARQKPFYTTAASDQSHNISHNKIEGYREKISDLKWLIETWIRVITPQTDSKNRRIEKNIIYQTHASSKSNCKMAVGSAAAPSGRLMAKSRDREREWSRLIHSAYWIAKNFPKDVHALQLSTFICNRVKTLMFIVWPWSVEWQLHSCCPSVTTGEDTTAVCTRTLDLK